jgi:Family of unknown function (DUF6152)
MRMKTFTLPILLFGVLLVSISTSAHHGESNYDTTEVVVVKGTVSDFQFANPHVLIYVDARDSSGNLEKWTCEATSPNFLFRRSWTKATLKQGDEITVSGHRSKNGAPLLRLLKVVANGKEYGNL